MNNGFKRYVSSPFITWLGKRRAARHFSSPPILIGGCGRSGTTLLLSILSAHPAIHILPWESRVFAQWKEAPEGPLKYLPRRPDRLYRNIMANRIPRSVTRWCEKTPSNVLYIGNILQYFAGEVRFIHLVRDGRDVMTSIHPDNPAIYWISPERWVKDVRAGLAFQQHPAVLTLRYEDLILDHDNSLRQICDFLGEELTAEMLNWHQNAALRRNQAWFSGLQERHSNSLRKWEKPQHQERLREVMADPGVTALLQELGYLYQ